MEKVSPNFYYHELACPCCNEMKCNTGSIDRLEKLRHFAGDKPISISSAYRCKKHNAEVSKHDKSAHVTGHAFDIPCSGSRAYEIVEAAIKAGFTRIGIKQNGSIASRFIHVGDETDKPNLTPWIWTY